MEARKKRLQREHGMNKRFMQAKHELERKLKRKPTAQEVYNYLKTKREK